MNNLTNFQPNSFMAFGDIEDNVFVVLQYYHYYCSTTNTLSSISPKAMNEFD